MKVLKKEQNLYKKSQQIQTGTEQIRQISGGIKKSLCASNIGEAEQEEESRNSQAGSMDFVSRMEKQIRENSHLPSRTESYSKDINESFSISEGKTFTPGIRESHPISEGETFIPSINEQYLSGARESFVPREPYPSGVGNSSSISINEELQPSLREIYPPNIREELLSRIRESPSLNINEHPIAEMGRKDADALFSVETFSADDARNVQNEFLQQELDNPVENIFMADQQRRKGRDQSIRNKYGKKQTVSDTSTKTNPYGWGSSTGKNQAPWESSSGKSQISWQSAGMDQANTTGQVASFSTLGGSTAGGVASGAAGEVAGSTAGSVVSGSVGSTAGGVASGAAGGPAGVVVSSSVTLLQKGKELIEESLQRRQQQVEQRQSSDSGTGTGIGTYLLGGMAAFGILISVLICSIGAILFSLSAQQNSIVEVAKAEVEVWEDNIGGDKYKEWYGVNGNWCAMFVSWCSDQCGYIDDGIMPKTASVNSMSLWYKARGQFEYKASGYEPKAGDIIFFQEEGASHTGIVIDYEPETSTVITIEGNTGNSDTDPYHEGSRVKEKRYPLTYSTISGYGLPEYPQNIPGTSTESTELEAMIPKRYIAA